MLMNTTIKKKYNAKVLLFGEYTIIDGGSALSVPFSEFSGHWCELEGRSLIPFFNHLKSIKKSNQEKLDSAINNNWTFCSNIPIGYGCGSSGALTAAAYESFFDQEANTLKDEKVALAEIENFFHGQSSGLDPLVSLKNKPILVNDRSISTVGLTSLNMAFFLVDSKRKRKTSDLVKVYNQKKAESATFRENIETLNKHNDQAISALLCGDKSNLLECFRKISQIQWEYFQEMIPDNIKPIWIKGLETNAYYLKLSGAGGGGFFLGIGNYNGESIQLDF